MSEPKPAVPPPDSFISEARRSFYRALLDRGLLSSNANGIPSMSDKDSNPSVRIGKGLLTQLRIEATGARMAGQMAGSKFETVVADYLTAVMPRLKALRPGRFSVIAGTSRLAIADCDQYDHLRFLEGLAKEIPKLAAAIGTDYLIRPDVMVVRYPESDTVINGDGAAPLVDDHTALLTSARARRNTPPTLHASISCKFTLRSDRAQNARSEALNLIRNRKGRLPHVVVITAEPTPGRIASIALGTGDIDCTYHIALPELLKATEDAGLEDSLELLNDMISGKRLRDVSDLPLDLTV